MTVPANVASTHDELIRAAIESASAAKMAIMNTRSELIRETKFETLKTALDDVVAKLETVEETAQKAASKRVVLSLSVSRPQDLIEEEKRQKRVDRGQMMAGGTFALITGLILLNDWLVAHHHIWIHVNVSPKLAVLPLLLVDIFLGMLLYAVIKRGISVIEKFPYIPNRGPALILLVTLYLALVLSCAHINIAWSLADKFQDALYHGFLTVATLEHYYDSAVTSEWPQILVGFELLSVFLLLVVFFPLLIARLALFEGETVSAENLRTIGHLNTGALQTLEFNLSADSPMEWRISGIGGRVADGQRDAKLRVDDNRKTTIEAA